MQTTLRGSLGLGLLLPALCLTFACATAQSGQAHRTRQRFESFDRDPGFDARNNHTVALDRPIVRQRFGWRPTNFAGGEPGEIGGVVWRSITPAYYGMPLDRPHSFEDPLSVSGRFALGQMVVANQWHTASAVYLGFFNHREQGWRAINYLGLCLYGHRDYEYTTYEGVPAGALVSFGVGTSKYAAAGGMLGEMRSGLMRDMDPEKMVNILPDGKSHTFSLTYDPKGAGGRGVQTFILDGKSSSTVPLRSHFKKHGATFDRFGIFNEQIPGYQMTVFFDDLIINGRKYDFAQDPGWEGKGNNATFNDGEQYGTMNIGWSQTHHAGGKKPGEMGGRLWSVNDDQDWIKAHYGARIGHLSFEDRLVARGKIAFPRFGIDSSIQIGWYNGADQTFPSRSFVGVLLDSLSSDGRLMIPYMNPKTIVKEDKQPETSGDRIQFIPDGSVYDFTFNYDPAGGDGNGLLTVELDGQKATLALTPAQRAAGADLDRFGMFNVQGNNGKYCDVFLDDIEFTVEAGAR